MNRKSRSSGLLPNVTAYQNVTGRGLTPEMYKAQGKPQIVIIGAIMNKLLHIIYRVLKHQKPFDPEYLKKT